MPPLGFVLIEWPFSEQKGKAEFRLECVRPSSCLRMDKRMEGCWCDAKAQHAFVGALLTCYKPEHSQPVYTSADLGQRWRARFLGKDRSARVLLVFSDTVSSGWSFTT